MTTANDTAQRVRDVLDRNAARLHAARAAIRTARENAAGDITLRGHPDEWTGVTAVFGYPMDTRPFSNGRHVPAGYVMSEADGQRWFAKIGEHDESDGDGRNVDSDPTPPANPATSEPADTTRPGGDDGDRPPPVDRNVTRVGRDHPDTSKKAAAAAFPRSGTKRRRIFDLIASKWPDGMTDDEIERATGWTHQSVSASRNSLAGDGWIADSGDTRKVAASGNDAIVWTLTGHGRREAQR